MEEQHKTLLYLSGPEIFLTYVDSLLEPLDRLIHSMDSLPPPSRFQKLSIDMQSVWLGITCEHFAAFLLDRLAAVRSGYNSG